MLKPGLRCRVIDQIHPVQQFVKDFKIAHPDVQCIADQVMLGSNVRVWVIDGHELADGCSFTDAHSGKPQGPADDGSRLNDIAVEDTELADAAPSKFNCARRPNTAESLYHNASIL